MMFVLNRELDPDIILLSVAGFRVEITRFEVNQ